MVFEVSRLQTWSKSCQQPGQIVSERAFSAFGDFKLAKHDGSLESPGLLVTPYYLSFTPSSLKSKCISTAQARRICWARAGALRDCALLMIPCAFSDLVITFRGRRKRTLFFGHVVGFQTSDEVSSKSCPLASGCCFEVLLVRIALAGLRDVNLDVQTFWQAQCFVDFVAGAALPGL